MDRAEAIRKIGYGLEMETSEMTPFGQLTVVRTDALKVALDALREQESLAQATSKWVSVEERLPTVEDANQNESVLAINKDEGFVKSWWYEIVVRYPHEFTHWMPLPQPPKEGAE